MVEARRDNENTSGEDTSDVINDLRKALSLDESPLDITQASSMSEEEIKALSPEQLATISDNQVRVFIEFRQKDIRKKEIKSLTQSGAISLKDNEIMDLSEDAIDTITDTDAQNIVKTRRKELIRKKYQGSDATAINGLSEDEVNGITEEQIAAMTNRQAKEALRTRKKDIERRKYEYKTKDEIGGLSLEEISTITQAQINAINNPEARKAVKDRKKEIERTKYKDKNVNEISALNDAQIVDITEEQIAAITDQNAQEAVRKRKIEIDAKQKVVGFRTIEGENLTPDQVTDKIKEELDRILNDDTLNISPAVKAALKKQAELRARRLQEERNLKPYQDALDQKEIDMQKTIENRKNLELIFRDTKFLLGGAMVGAALAMLISGNVNVSTILLGSAAGGIVLGGGGMFIDRKISIDRKKIETEMLQARLEAKKKEGVKTQREEAALRRETNASIAFSQKAAELYARISGLTDPKQVAQYTQTFMNSLDYQMLTAIG